jgi:hypothetical protein
MRFCEDFSLYFLSEFVLQDGKRTITGPFLRGTKHAPQRALRRPSQERKDEGTTPTPQIHDLHRSSRVLPVALSDTKPEGNHLGGITAKQYISNHRRKVKSDRKKACVAKNSSKKATTRKGKCREVNSCQKPFKGYF